MQTELHKGRAYCEADDETSTKTIKKRSTERKGDWKHDLKKIRI